MSRKKQVKRDPTKLVQNSKHDNVVKCSRRFEKSHERTRAILSSTQTHLRGYKTKKVNVDPMHALDAKKKL